MVINSKHIRSCQNISALNQLNVQPPDVSVRRILTELVAKPSNVKVSNVLATNQDISLAGLVEAEQQTHNGGFTESQNTWR